MDAGLREPDDRTTAFQHGGVSEGRGRGRDPSLINGRYWVAAESLCPHSPLVTLTPSMASSMCGHYPVNRPRMEGEEGSGGIEREREREGRLSRHLWTAQRRRAPSLQLCSWGESDCPPISMSLDGF